MPKPGAVKRVRKRTSASLRRFLFRDDRLAAYRRDAKESLEKKFLHGSYRGASLPGSSCPYQSSCTGLTYCARTSPLPLLPSGPGGVCRIAPRRARHTDESTIGLGAPASRPALPAQHAQHAQHCPPGSAMRPTASRAATQELIPRSSARNRAATLAAEAS